MTIRVLIVDDSLFFQHRLKELLEVDPLIRVIGQASNGREAIDRTITLKPDIITMDIEMPVMDGITAVRQIMRDCPTPVLMISATTKRGAKATFDAMDAGALDFLMKDFDKVIEDREKAGKEIRNKVISIAKSAADLSNSNLPATAKGQGRSAHVHSHHHEILAIGASTGGPVAVQKLLRALPQDFPLPVVVMQHMPATFTPLFSERMNKCCEISVKHAEDNDLLFPGCAYIAPGGMQMKVKKHHGENILDISAGDPSLAYKPSIDLTYRSLDEVYPGKVLAIILTGMGSDGCEGAKKLKQSGSEVWAQDEQSSVVYGMPMAVAKAGIADQILSIDNIGQQLANKLRHMPDYQSNTKLREVY